MTRCISRRASLAIVLLLTACDYGAFDNYDPPRSQLTGRVVYQGEPVGVRSNGVELELWQPSYELNEKIPVHVAQDGSFSAMLFDGDYKLNLLAGNGPWVDSQDTIYIQVRGDTEVEVRVTPYYVIENLSVGQAGGAVQANFQVSAVEPSRAVEHVGLYLSNTSFVDRINQAASTELSGTDIADLTAPITLSVNVPDELEESGWAYARVGVKTVGVSEMLYTSVERITF